jgi:hypothetical protein
MSLNPKHFIKFAGEAYKNLEKNNIVNIGGRNFKVIDVQNNCSGKILDISPENILKTAMTKDPSHILDNSSGYYGVAFQSIDNPKEIIVAHRGTQVEDATFAQSFKDIQTDLVIAKNQVSPVSEMPQQFTDAQSFTEQIMREHPDANIVHSGHSLGGGLAQYAAATNGHKSFSFDGPSVKDYIMRDVKSGVTINEKDHILYRPHDSHTSATLIDNRFGETKIIYPKNPDELSFYDKTPFGKPHKLENIDNCFKEDGTLKSDEPGYWDTILQKKWESNDKIGTRKTSDGYENVFVRNRYNTFEEYKNSYLNTYKIGASNSSATHSQNDILSYPTSDILTKSSNLMQMLK